jgi:hypothetical protein
MILDFLIWNLLYKAEQNWIFTYIIQNKFSILWTVWRSAYARIVMCYIYFPRLFMDVNIE